MAGSINKELTYAQQLYVSGMSIPEVSDECGIKLSTLRFQLKNLGLLRDRKTAIRLAAKKGKLGSGLRGKNRVFSDSHKAAISKSRQLWADKNAKGVSYKTNGYAEFTRGENKGRSVHVVKMESRLGRPLKQDECVHHIDGNRSNNQENNLALVTKSGHTRLHRFEDGLQGKTRERDQHGRFC